MTHAPATFAARGSSMADSPYAQWYVDIANSPEGWRVSGLIQALEQQHRDLVKVARDLRRPRGWFFNWREHMSAMSIRVDNATAQLDAIANQFPPAVGAAITKAHDAGVTEGQAQGAADPDIGPALDKFETQLATTTAALQASIAPPVAQPTAGA